MANPMTRGSIYHAELDPGLGSEQEGARPVVIIQNNKGNKHSPTVIAAMITCKKKTDLPTHVKVSGLPKPSIIMTEQLRTLDKGRLIDYLGHLTDEEIVRLDQSLEISLGLGKGAIYNE